MSHSATPSIDPNVASINPGLAAGSQKPEAGQFGVGKDVDTQARVLERAENDPPGGKGPASGEKQTNQCDAP